MKLLAICINSMLLITLSYLMIKDGVSGDKAPLIILFFAAPISSLAALSFSHGDSWLGLYLKRKTLEEKQKIAKLGSEN